jgi:hypothetical protein
MHGTSAVHPAMSASSGDVHHSATAIGIGSADAAAAAAAVAQPAGSDEVIRIRVHFCDVNIEHLKELVFAEILDYHVSERRLLSHVTIPFR